ncbi:class IV aminotransferase [Streptomyces venezuelae]|uniref:Class IV aminotransferase n=1 Tax=Streptomyces venezuelae TaxID=54571 RepID=A0A5P2C731_STRVZ|nr:aminotransferase class IV [Streptomyces venezuelae]QES36519.1 class IV aminotransferase [Streptomyces venezuelae]
MRTISRAIRRTCSHDHLRTGAAHRDRRAARAESLLWPALVQTGHFTAMQVRGGKVRGLGLHLARLDAATRELFGHGIDGEHVRGLVRHILRDDIADASVRVYVHAPDGEPSHMVTVRPPTELPATMEERAQSLRSVAYQRPFAHIKHLGGFGQARHAELARGDGFDEVLLTGPGGEVSEGAVTNVAFFDGTDVVWPDAPHLAGITMQLVRSRLPAAGLATRHAPVTLADLPSYRAAFVTNAWGVRPVRRIDDVAYGVDERLMARVAGAYEDVPWDTL